MAIGERFEVGQRVRATASAQGLERGSLYEVVEIERGAMLPRGSMVSYRVREVVEYGSRPAPLWIENASFVLEGVRS
jgi:hypothetical protein